MCDTCAPSCLGVGFQSSPEVPSQKSNQLAPTNANHPYFCWSVFISNIDPCMVYNSLKKLCMYHRCCLICMVYVHECTWIYHIDPMDLMDLLSEADSKSFRRRVWYQNHMTPDKNTTWINMNAGHASKWNLVGQLWCTAVLWWRLMKVLNKCSCSHWFFPKLTQNNQTHLYVCVLSYRQKCTHFYKIPHHPLQYHTVHIRFKIVFGYIIPATNHSKTFNQVASPIVGHQKYWFGVLGSWAMESQHRL